MLVEDAFTRMDDGSLILQAYCMSNQAHWRSCAESWGATMPMTVHVSILQSQTMVRFTGLMHPDGRHCFQACMESPLSLYYMSLLWVHLLAASLGSL